MHTDYRLLAIDLDGTLLNSRHEVSLRNREALHRAHEAGLVVCLCTGRSLTESREVIAQIGLDLNAGVFVFGAIVADLAAGETLFRNSMDPAIARRLTAEFQAAGHPMLVLYDAAETGFDYHYVEGEHLRDAYERWLSLAPTRTHRVPSSQEAADLLPSSTPAPLRVSIIESPDRVDEALASVRRKFEPAVLKVNSIYAPNYGLHVIECFAPRVSKWLGLTQLAGRLGIEERRIVAVGDDVNDVEMLTHAGLAAAMGNANPAARQVARLELPDNDHDGVAVLIQQVLSGTAPPPAPIGPISPQ